MAICKKIPRMIERVCIGSLNQRIKIFVRELKPNINGGFDLSPTSIEQEVWAMVETVRGVTLFDSTGIERVISHVFYIRRPYPFIVDVTRVLEFKGFNKSVADEYDIRQVEDLNEERRFLALRCELKGRIDYNRNKA